MAAPSNTRTPLSLTPPSQIPKDMPGPDNLIPLSPQWLLPKPGDDKAGTALKENHPTPHVSYGDSSDVIKSPGNSDEMHDNQKKRDVFRPTFLDMESGRRDRWRDEERDTNLSARKDRWREGDRDIGDNRKTDRWGDNASARHLGEARRTPPADRWVDPSREIDRDQQSGSKQNTRWGSGEKEMDKWTVGKTNDAPFDKGVSHLSTPAKDEREADRYRPWRPSSLQGRGRAEPPHHHTKMTGKEVSTLNQGRGRGDNTPLTFSAGRGRVSYGSGSSNICSSYSRSGFVPERGDNGLREPSPFSYTKTRLLDIFRLIDLRSPNKILDGMAQVPSLTHEDFLEPFALCVPSAEETTILKAIDKGDIISSGAPQISKDGSSGRSSVDFATSRQRQLGSRGDVSFSPDHASDKVDNTKGVYSGGSECVPHGKQTNPYGSNVTLGNMDNHQRYIENKYSVEGVGDDAVSSKQGEEIYNNRDTTIKGGVSAQPETPWRAATVAEPLRTPSWEYFNVPNEIHSRSSDMSWLQAPKNRPNSWENILPDQSYTRNELGCQGGDVVDKEMEPRKLLQQPSPEDLLLYYKDPQGLIQGPFSGSDVIGWFEAGYFGMDLLVRLASAPNDSPFSLLGDVMPHLRAKAGPPPGFNPAKQTDVIEMPNKLSSSGFGNAIPGGVGNESRHVHGSSVEAENRFLESLMSGEISGTSLETLASKEGLHGFQAAGMPKVAAESGDALGLLAKRMNLERQNSLSNPYTYWPPSDASPVVPNPDINRHFNMPQGNPLSSIANVSQQSHPQNVDIVSAFQGLSDRSSAGMNNKLEGWPNLHGSNELLKDKIDVPHGQNFPQAVYGMQQHVLQQNHPSISQAMLTEKLLSSGLVQDPHLLNILQQQYLLQMQSQQPVTSPQLSLLDRFLLLQQQQKQEEQQKLFQQQQLLQQQQQQLLSKVLSEQLPQRFGDLAFRPTEPTGSPAPNLLNQLFQLNSQIPIPSLEDRNVNPAYIPPKDSMDLSRTVTPEGSSFLHLPHQMLRGLPEGWSSVPVHASDAKFNSSSLGSAVAENLCTSEALERSEGAIFTMEPRAPPSMETLENHLPGEVEVNADRSSPSEPIDDEVLKPEAPNEADFICTVAFGETPVTDCNEENSAVEEAKNVEPQEVKTTSGRKSRKQKSSKAQSSTDQVKAISKESNVQRSKQSPVDALIQAPVYKVGEVSSSKDELSLSANLPSGASVSDAKVDQSAEGNSAQRAWKPAVSVKPKSLLEIQEEEQRRARMEAPRPDTSTSDSSTTLSTPWGAGVAASKESKVTRETLSDSRNGERSIGMWDSAKNKKSGLHDLLAAEDIAKSSNRSIEVSEKASSLLPLPNMSQQLDFVDDSDFIEAKDTKKSRKKAAKSKGATAKASTTTSLTELAVTSSPSEKGKSPKPVQTEREVLPSSSGPSLGDFVPWKEESTSPSQAPAWLSEPPKFPKPTSLRDILREQEKKVTSVQQHSQISIPRKPQSTQTRGASRSVLVSSSSKTASPALIPSDASSQMNRRGEDDLFWGPPEQSKLETTQPDFPQLANHVGQSMKNTPIKGTSGAPLRRQKSAGGNASQHYASSPPASAQIPTKGKKEGNSKRSEAVDFREWCESESARLTGSRDTSFLEFCLKQSKSEAEMLLKENLGSFDPKHVFIEKFLNYMEFLPADILETAFQSRNDLVAYNSGARDVTSGYGGIRDFDRDIGSADVSASLAKGGKKKGKKGKKVSPLVLGFNVVSNRIMMGEIQTLEE